MACAIKNDVARLSQHSPSSVGKLPSELWKMVVEELGCSPRRNELLPLLYTSRFFYALVAPIFYETIALFGFALLRRVPESTTYACSRTRKRSCPSLLNQSCAQYTKTIFEHFGISLWDHSDHHQIVTDACERLAHVHNLERLSIFAFEEEHLSLLIKAIPLSAPITHLSITIQRGCHALPSFLSVHSSTLRFLQIEDEPENFDDLDDLDVLPSMPSLRTFQGTSNLWTAAIKSAPIKHLAASDRLENVVENLAVDLFDNLTSFMIYLHEIHVIDVQSLMNLPSKRLRYINFSRDKPLGNFDNVVDALFHRYPSLDVIEFSEGEFRCECQVFRYNRLDIERKPEQFWRREPGTFESWFECIGKDFAVYCGEE
ncbi:hypothetical protein ONZ45_g10508 [Pleurotus djamor]|nr:hypothetical protein ONZ45_g10508 [Pleurotus djamor]